MKKRFTLDDIDELLEEIGFKWLDKQVRNIENNKYESAAIKHFKQPTTYLLIECENGQKFLISAQINQEQFIIRFDKTKLDLSQDWVDKLNNKAKGL